MHSRITVEEDTLERKQREREEEEKEKEEADKVAKFKETKKKKAPLDSIHQEEWPATRNKTIQAIWNAGKRKTEEAVKSSSLEDQNTEGPPKRKKPNPTRGMEAHQALIERMQREKLEVISKKERRQIDSILEDLSIWWTRMEVWSGKSMQDEEKQER